NVTGVQTCALPICRNLQENTHIHHLLSGPCATQVLQLPGRRTGTASLWNLCFLPQAPGCDRQLPGSRVRRKLPQVHLTAYLKQSTRYQKHHPGISGYSNTPCCPSSPAGFSEHWHPYLYKPECRSSSIR